MIQEKGKKITIDDLARMMNRSFEDIRENMASKKDLHEVKEQLDRIENKVNTNQENRISKLEDDVRVLKTAVGK